jgi:hypothetical protein
VVRVVDRSGYPQAGAAIYGERLVADADATYFDIPPASCEPRPGCMQLSTTDALGDARIPIGPGIGVSLAAQRGRDRSRVLRIAPGATYAQLALEPAPVVSVRVEVDRSGSMVHPIEVRYGASFLGEQVTPGADRVATFVAWPGEQITVLSVYPNRVEPIAPVPPGVVIDVRMPMIDFASVW